MDAERICVNGVVTNCDFTNRSFVMPEWHLKTGWPFEVTLCDLKEDVGMRKNPPSEKMSEKTFRPMLTYSDDGHDAANILGRISSYYGNPGALAHECVRRGIPVMLMNAE